MSESEILRRASYGPTSPVVGERGTRTRGRIVAETLKLFEAQGFHTTSVDDIAKAAGVSRATLYQYFESKEQVFLELLEECGSALMRVVRRIGPLGPDALGFDNLHWWLGEWAWVFDKYATMFVQWASVDSPGTAVRPRVRGFIEAYDRRIAERLASCGVTGITPEEAAMTMTTIVNQVNYFRHVGLTDGQSDEAILDNLAVVVQLMLFPLTPAEAFSQLTTVAPASTRPARPASPQPVDLALLESPVDVPESDRFAHLSRRAATTVRQLLNAGASVFARQGYHSASVDDVVAAAGFARGTFYKYFDEKLDLLDALSEEASQAATALSFRFQKITLDEGESAQLRAWLVDFVAFQQRYLGVTRTWLEATPDDPQLAQARRRVGLGMRTVFRSVLSQVERPYPLDLDVAGTILFAFLERLPDVESNSPETREKLVETVATMIERGLLNGRPLGRAPSAAL